MRIDRRKFLTALAIPNLINLSPLPAPLSTERSISTGLTLDVSVDIDSMLNYAPYGSTDEEKSVWVNQCMEEINRAASCIRPGDTYIHPNFISVKTL